MPWRVSVLRFGLGLAAVVAVLDQLTKWWVIERLMRPVGVAETPFFTSKAVTLAPFLDIVMTWNRGFSFGLFNDDGRWNALVLSVLAIVIVTFLVLWLRRTEDRVLGLTLGLIIGGAVGNVVDRIRFGAVADFIHFHVGAFSWPAFNLADAAITVGAATLVADALFRRDNSHKNRA